MEHHRQRGRATNPAQNRIAQGFKLCVNAPKRVGGSRLSNGELARVEWSGREASIGVYQGNLPKKDKETVQGNIREFLANAAAAQDPTAESWSTVRALVDRLLEAATPESFPGQSFTQDHQNSGLSSSRQ